MPSATKKRTSDCRTKSERQQERRLEKLERDKLICYRFAQLRNASHVAKEYGVSRMYVTRAWERLTGPEREALLELRDQADETLNRKIAKAEAIAGDAFVASVVRSRELLAEELLRRCESTYIRTLNAKDFTSLLRLAAAIASPGSNADKPSDPADDLFKTLRESIHRSIDKE